MNEWLDLSWNERESLVTRVVGRAQMERGTRVLWVLQDGVRWLFLPRGVYDIGADLLEVRAARRLLGGLPEVRGASLGMPRKFSLASHILIRALPLLAHEAPVDSDRDRYSDEDDSDVNALYVFPDEFESLESASGGQLCGSEEWEAGIRLLGSDAAFFASGVFPPEDLMRSLGPSRAAGNWTWALPHYCRDAGLRALVRRGGAASQWPFQTQEEWLLTLPSAVFEVDSNEACVVRPIRHL